MEIEEVIERGRKDKLPALIRLIKFSVSLKHILLQRLINCSMQEQLLLQIN